MASLVMILVNFKSLRSSRVLWEVCGVIQMEMFDRDTIEEVFSVIQLWFHIFLLDHLLRLGWSIIHCICPHVFLHLCVNS